MAFILKNALKIQKTSFTELLSGEETIPLTEAQQIVYEPIKQMMDLESYNTFLLHGVTGSGKTQIYLKSAARCIGKGKTAIILVPEIILTDQIVRRFVSTFGDEVCCFP